MSLSLGVSSAAQAAAMTSAFQNMGQAIPVTDFEGYQNVGSTISRTGRSISSFLRSQDRKFDSAVSQFETSSNKVSASRAGSSSGSESVPLAASINYIDAPLAQQYGMNAATAYQEALANTAHQREMLDLQRAGLNPVLAARYSGAGVFSPDSMVTASGPSGSGGSGRSAKSTSGALPILLGAIATIASGKTAVGAAVSTAADAILPAFIGSK